MTPRPTFGTKGKGAVATSAASFSICSKAKLIGSHSLATNPTKNALL